MKGAHVKISSVGIASNKTDRSWRWSTNSKKHFGVLETSYAGKALDAMSARSGASDERNSAKPFATSL